MDVTPGEIMVAQAAREIRDDERVFVGMRLPLIAFVVAKRTHAPNAVGLFELGIVRDEPSPELLYTMGDPPNVRGATWCARTVDLMGLLARGEVDAGFIGAAEIDVHGNLNTTAIGGDRAHPTVQLPGSGGSADIASLAKRLIVIMPHEKKRLRHTVDFITSPGYLDGGEARGRAGLPRGGPSVLITTRAVYRFFGDGKAYLWSIHPGYTIRDVSDESDWLGPGGIGIVGVDPKEQERRDAGILDVQRTEAPSPEVLRIIRQYDPQGFWTRRGE
jgi:glutaconate CoA-transferase subunit B